MRTEVAHALLYLGVACQVVCVVGCTVMRGPFDRLHYVGAGSTLGPLLVGAAIVLSEGGNSAALETIAAVSLIFLLAPASTILTARAARRQLYGDVEARPEERIG